MPVEITALRTVMREATSLARQYRELTGKPLGITGEVGEFLAAELLGLVLVDARQPGYDAIAPDGRRIQIKTRCILPDAKQGQRVGGIKLDYDWETVALVLIDENFEPSAIYEAPRSAVEEELHRPGSRARNERGALGVNKFKAISKCVWCRKEN